MGGLEFTSVLSLCGHAFSAATVMEKAVLCTWTLLSFEVASHQATKSDEGELCRLDVGFSVVLTPFHTIAHFSNEAKYSARTW